MSISAYQELFKSLNPNKSNGHIRPHKMCMLLAVMDLIEQGKIKENKFHFDSLLCEQFSLRFEQFKKVNDSDSPELPFFHLKSSEFWHHKIKFGRESDYQSIKKSTSARAIRDSIEYAYLNDDLFQFLFEPESRQLLVQALAQNFASPFDFYAQWARQVGNKEKTVKNYVGAITGSISRWAIAEGIIQDGLHTFDSVKDFRKIVEQIKSMPNFVEFNQRGNSMYSAALNSYEKFLADFTQEDLNDDIDEIINNPAFKPTEKSSMVSTRLGQGDFRKDVIKLCGACAVTGYKNVSLLIASHIKPWRAATASERLDGENGLLLLPNLDKVFDKGYVTFKGDGKIIISKELDDFQSLGLSSEMSLNIPLSYKHREYLEYHRDVEFEGWVASNA